MVKVLISPAFDGPDQGDGGIRRVVEAQRRHLPTFGVEVVETEAAADAVAVHAGSLIQTQKPVIAHNHGLYWTEYPWSRWALDLNRQVINTLRRCDACTAPSDWVGYILRRGMNLDATTVYHGLDAAEWQPGPVRADHPYVLWNKTRVDAICDPRPVNALAALLPDVDFVSTFGEQGSNVRITGKLPHEQARSLVQNAAVYLCTARETFGIGTLEAMASGAVVVGWNWGGQAEIITDGVDGLLVPPGDVDGLAFAVQRAVDPAFAAPLCEAARRTVTERFTWERACEQYALIYRQAVEQAATKRVSVVITCYGLAHTLPRAVASVDARDAEIVVVDDASPDDTAAVAAGLAASDPRIKVVTNPSNLYLAGSLDAGVRASTGAYVCPLDADNELAPGALDALATALDTDPDVDVAYGSMMVVTHVDGEPDKQFVSGWPAAFNYEAQMAHRNQVPSTSMYRRKWWKRAGGYRRRCRTAEDADFWCRVTSLGAQPRKVVPRHTLIYHDRADSMSRTVPDWPWHNWYTWSRVPDLTPFGAPRGSTAVVPTYEPPAVTVVIPVGPGHDVLLPDALDSLVAQTYIGWRCIVIDDRPPPDVLSVPPWVEILGTPGGKGPAHARNMGLIHTRTPWVLFLDADDYLAPDALEVMLRAAHERGGPGKEWFYSDWYKQEEGKVYQAPDFNVEHLRTHLTHSVTAMYPTALLREVGGFDEKLDAWEDWDMVLKLIEAGACGVHLPWPLFYYRYHAGARRELLYAGRERHTQVMKAKWHKYMVEGVPMPCGCAGGQTVYIAPVQVNGAPVPVSREGKTLVEYTGPHAPRTWRGPSGAEYRFGNDTGHKRSYVLNEDLAIFMNKIGFRLALADADGNAILEAAGPPDRMAEFREPPRVAVPG